MNTTPISLSVPARPVTPIPRAASAAPVEVAVPRPEPQAIPAEQAPVPPPQGREPSDESLRKAVEEANHKIQTLTNTSVQFEIDQDTGDVRIRVVDKDTNQVIRWIPPEGLQQIIGQDGIRGLLLNSQG